HRGFGHPCRPTGLRPLALAVPPSARRGVLRRLCLASAANHGPRGRSGHPAGGRLPPTGARHLRERRVPAIPLALLARRKRRDAPRPGVGRRGARRAAGGGGGPGPGSPAALDLLLVARRSGPDLPLVPVGRAAARDRTPGGSVRTHATAAQSHAGAPALDGDAVAGVGAPVPADVPLR